MSLEAQDAVRGSMSEKLDLTPAMEMVRNYNPGIGMDPADVSALVKKYLPPMFALISSQAAEIERLNARVTQAENQATEAYGREFDAAMVATRLREAIEKACHANRCASHQMVVGIYREVFFQQTDKPCDCWKAAALVQVSASPQPSTEADKRTTGIYRKFRVSRVDGKDLPGEKHDGCRYFVLDATHDPHAKPALVAYADSCKADYPVLARDVREMASTPDDPDVLTGTGDDSISRDFVDGIKSYLEGQ